MSVFFWPYRAPTPQVQELRGNIRVFCRARPPSVRELERGAASDGAVCVAFPDSGVIKVCSRI